jgi:catechol 2,3-dioxygenase-like lactoylglutathione lyase family enzyme
MSAAPPFAIAGLDHVVIVVGDMAGAIEFWSKGLGARLERRVDDIGLVQLRAGASLIDLVPRAEDAAGRNVEHICVRIEPWDEKAIRAHLGACDIEAGGAEERHGAEGDGPSIYIEDREGNQIELKGPAVRGTAEVKAALSSELEATHGFLDEWLMGACAQQRQVLDERLVKRLEPDFSMISVSGRSLARDQFVQRLERNYGSTPNLRSEIRYLRLISDSGGLVVASYEDWRRDWNNQSLSNDSRLSTAIFRRNPLDRNELRWLHLHRSGLPN